MFDPALLELPVDAVAAFSKSQTFGIWEVYAHLQGDRSVVAEHLIERTRKFFSSPAEAQAFVEGQPRNPRSERLGAYVWKPRTHFAF
jgi:hypothetical protein